MDSSLIAGKYLRSTQPNGAELASEVVSLTSLTVMSLLFGIKTYNVQFRFLSYSRWLVLLLYALSWAFTFTSTIFVSTNNGNFLSCFLSEMACNIFYSATKIIIYCWLIEKVWVVSSSRNARRKTRSYIFHLILLTPYIAILTLMIIFHNAQIEETGACFIGLKPIASTPLLVYDFVFNTYMTLLFIRSLIRVGKNAQLDWRASRLHEVARRTLIASIIALFVSFANILALMILHGLEQGVLCLTCCTVDVTINVITVHWVTSSPNGKPLRDAKGNTIITSSSDNGSTIQVNSIDKRGSRDKDNIHHYVYSLQEFSEVKPPDPTYDDSPLSPNIRNYTSMHYKNYVVNKDTKDDELSIEACSIQSSQQSLTNKVYK